MAGNVYARACVPFYLAFLPFLFVQFWRVGSFLYRVWGLCSAYLVRWDYYIWTLLCTCFVIVVVRVSYLLFSGLEFRPSYVLSNINFFIVKYEQIYLVIYFLTRVICSIDLDMNAILNLRSIYLNFIVIEVQTRNLSTKFGKNKCLFLIIITVFEKELTF